MQKRLCSGGVVFHNGEIFLLKNDKSEWVLPKGVIRSGRNARDVALERVRVETGVDAQIVDACGETRYEFFSRTRSKQVSNIIQWFAMRADDPTYRINFQLGFLDGGWFGAVEAADLVTHAQDKALVRRAHALIVQ